MSKEEQDGPDGKPCCDAKEDNEGTSCKINLDDENETGETMNLPFATEDGVTKVPLITNHPPLSPMHDWEHRLSSVLYEMIDMLENDKDHGYFDSIIDVQTHALLIEKAMRKYCDEHNKRWCKSEGKEYEGRIDLQTTPSQIEDHNRGGYSTKNWNRIHLALTGADCLDEPKDSGDVQG